MSAGRRKTFRSGLSDGDLQMSTFESDKIDDTFPWLQLIAAKLTSGLVASVSMVVRVFDPDDMIEVLCLKGCTSVPHKEI
jgi:hypothetical protein